MKDEGCAIGVPSAKDEGCAIGVPSAKDEDTDRDPPSPPNGGYGGKGREMSCVNDE